ncbi:MAG: hypothetical protein AB1631_28925, partial [Acidobacteriota bacterium]
DEVKRLASWWTACGAGRPIGSGLFKTKTDFRTALWDTFAQFTKKPTQAQAIKKLRQHELCQRKESEGAIQNQTKTLRDWLSGYDDFENFDDAWDAYCWMNQAGYSSFDDGWKAYRQSIASGK